MYGRARLPASKSLFDWELRVRLQDYAASDLIALDIEARDKQELLAGLVELLVQSGRVRDAAGLMGELLKREQVMSTGIGGGIAIPHALTNDIATLVLVFGRTRAPMDFQAVDGLPVDLVFMLVGPKAPSNSAYVKLLARVSRLLQSEAFKERLREAETAADALEVFASESEYTQ
jgi:mannitol/fructose-specific phosphotransferase system IIA component (Ntr-type)